ncbi:MAG: DUF1972 domain-containing protein [Vicinamibacterales bacterium]
MRLAILGTRGIPANYGGFETFAEELSSRLAARGHEVTVYGRRHYVPAGLKEYRGVRLVILPTIRHKYFDTVVHTAVSTMHAVGRRFDALLYCNAANAVFTLLPRLAGSAVALNVDGIERLRQKWNRLGKAWYALSERLAVRLPHAIVTDARLIERYYRERYGATSYFIPYGSGFERVRTTEALSRLGLEPRRYLLYVSRLEPENNAHRVIAGYEQAGIDVPLVIVGDAPYARDYIESLKRMAGPGVKFTGAIYGQGYRELQSHSLAYVHATEVGGTHPALVEAMGAGACALVNDVAENREVAGESAWYFQAADAGSLAALMRLAVSEPERARELGEAAAARARDLYSWDRITDRYEQLLLDLAAASEHKGAAGRPAGTTPAGERHGGNG